MKPHIPVLLAAALCVSAAAAQKGFVDEFDRAALGPAWKLVRLNSQGLLVQTPLSGKLKVAGFRGPRSKRPRNVYAKLVRAGGPVRGDFTAEMRLAWDVKDDSAMMKVALDALSAKGDALASVGVLDCWIAGPPCLMHAVGAKSKPVRGLTAPYRAEGTFCIERRGDVYTFKVKRGAWSLTLGTRRGAREDVAGLALSFAFFDYPAAKGYPASRFGEAVVERVSLSPGAAPAAPAPRPAGRWRLGKPIVTYWAGPAMSDALAEQLVQGGWNLAWARSPWDLDTLQRHGLRGLFSSRLFRPKTLDSPDAKARLDALLDAVKTHPALYAYHIKDEPGAGAFADYARVADYIRRKDPAHLCYFNLFPLGAKNRQLGTEGDRIAAYKEYLRRYIATIHPRLLSYDHYHFADDGDGDLYFANLAAVREAAVQHGLPFMAIVQACSWTKRRRIPTGEELRWLAYTTLAYGAQGVSYYVYGYRGHDGGMMNLADGSPTSLYWAASHINREFAAIAAQLQPLASLAAYHVGMQPPGAAPRPKDSPFRIEPPVPEKPYPATRPSRAGWPVRFSSEPVQGYLIGLFGKNGKATHALVVNLDYRTYAGRGWPRREEFLKPTRRFLAGPGPLETFDPKTGRWKPAEGGRVRLALPPGAGVLARVKP